MKSSSRHLKVLKTGRRGSPGPRHVSVGPAQSPLPVLVLDPDPEESCAVVSLLSAEFRPTVVTTREEAEVHLAWGQFAVLVVMQRTPGASGASLLTHVRRRWPVVQGVLIAAYPDWLSIADAIDAGGQAPSWSGAELLSLVSDAARTYCIQAAQLTARTMTERSLRLREQQYRSLVEHAPDGVLLTDRDGNYTEANAAICQLLGYTRDEITRLNVRDLVHVDEAGEPLWLDQVLAGQTLRVQRYLRAKNGQLVGVETSVRMLPDGRLEALVRDLRGSSQRERAS